MRPTNTLRKSKASTEALPESCRFAVMGFRACSIDTNSFTPTWRHSTRFACWREALSIRCWASWDQATPLLAAMAVTLGMAPSTINDRTSSTRLWSRALRGRCRAGSNRASIAPSNLIMPSSGYAELPVEPGFVFWLNQSDTDFTLIGRFEPNGNNAEIIPSINNALERIFVRQLEHRFRYKKQKC